jgi:hypothetical protein
MNRTIDFYKKGTGDTLTDPDNYPDAIKQYLTAEKDLLLRCLQQFEIVVEAGCTNGYYTNTILRAAKSYLGIDIAEHRIARAALKYEDHLQCMFVCDDICNLENIIADLSLSIKNTLIIFPFNAFGNLTQPHKVLQFLAKTSIKSIISTYKTDPETQKMRTLYYLNCGFENLTCNYSKEGVRFFNNSGLNTVAYNEQWFKNSFEEYKLQLRLIQLGEMGMAYMNF